MVSLQPPLSPNRRKPIPESDHLSKKRKWEEPFATQIFEKRSKAEETAKPIFYIDQHDHSETPLPLEWQRCLDIQSGQIHFYNTKTHRRTCKDPRRSPDYDYDSDPDLPISPVHASLDLELNLTCDQSVGKNNMDNHDHRASNNTSPGGSGKQKWNAPGGMRKCPSWLAFEMDQKQEMVATVCMRCHMLVMLCKSSPACPNCKFMHPPDQKPPALFKPRCSFFCL